MNRRALGIVVALFALGAGSQAQAGTSQSAATTDLVEMRRGGRGRHRGWGRGRRRGWHRGRGRAWGRRRRHGW
jgi:hypothetical protein